MKKKTISIITVIATILLCGLPGLVGLCFGFFSLIGSLLPKSGVPADDTGLVIGSSIMILGVSLVFIAIPIGVGIWSWWSQKSEAASMERLLIPEDDF